MKMLLNRDEGAVLNSFVKWNKLDKPENLEKFVWYLLAAERGDRSAIVKISSGLVFNALRKIFEDDEQTAQAVRACGAALPTSVEVPRFGVVNHNGTVRPAEMKLCWDRQKLQAAAKLVCQYF